MHNELQVARFFHSALMVGCAALIVLALTSTTAQTYVSGQQWLVRLGAIDLEKWAGRVENQQSLSLDNPFIFSVSTVIEEEAGNAQVRSATNIYVRRQVTMRVPPSAVAVRDATMEALLTDVFPNVESPELFYPDEQMLRIRLRELFSRQAAEGFSQLILSRALLDFDSARDASDRALLRLEWMAADTGSADVGQPVLKRDVSLAGAYKNNAFEFDEFIRQLHPDLAGSNPSWTEGVRKHLSPIWSEISGKTLGDANTYVEARLRESRGNISLLNFTIYRQQMLVFGSLFLLVLVSTVTVSVRRLDQAAAADYPGLPLFPTQLAPTLTFLSMVVLPVITIAYLIVMFGEARLSGEMLVAGCVAVASVTLAIGSYWRILQRRKPRLSEADRKRIELAKAQVVVYGRAGFRRSRIFGRVLLGIGLFMAPVGAFLFSIYLIGLGIGSQASGLLPMLAVLLSPVFILVGWTLAAGRKELILFLRRFGNEALNDSVRDLVQAVLRKRARLITLDDSDFESLGPRWRGLLVSLMPSAVVLGAIVLGYAEFATVAESELRDETPFGTALTLIRLGILFLGFLAGLVVAVLFAISIRARMVSEITIADGASRSRVVKRLRKLRSLRRAPVIAAPMATVVSVADAEWQPTVESIARMCNVVLIDISQPSESIRWELATLREAHIRMILLAQRHALGRWWGNEAGDDVDDPIAAQMRELARGLPLVRYDRPDRLIETDLLGLLSKPANHAL